MSSVKTHYDTHLGNFYSWMAGDFETGCRIQQQFFEQADLIPVQPGAHAIDLGCGHGLQSIALARMGYNVIAVDLNMQLLHELQQRKGELPITIAARELTDFSGLAPANLTVCMGDTLTHLASLEEVTALLRSIHKQLLPGGHLVISLRDYSTPLEDTARFIPVRADEKRIHTCVLEYADNTVRVTDLLHELTESGWKQRVSAYTKLRLSPARITLLLQQQGFRITHEETLNHMGYVVATPAGT